MHGSFAAVPDREFRVAPSAFVSMRNRFLEYVTY